MKKFKCTVTRVDEYIIELDENVLNEEWMEHFRSYMCPYYELSQHAENLANFQARFGNSFIEGYGYVKRNGRELGLLEEKEDRKPAPGINIVIVDEDNVCEVETEEIL